MKSSATSCTALAVAITAAALSAGTSFVNALPHPQHPHDARSTSAESGPQPLTVPLTSKILSSGITDLKELFEGRPSATTGLLGTAVNALKQAGATGAADDSSSNAEQAQLSTLAGWTAYLQQKYGVPATSFSSSSSLTRRADSEAAGESLSLVDGWSYYVGLINVGGLDHEVFIDTGSSDLWMYKSKWNATGPSGLPVPDPTLTCSSSNFTIAYADRSRVAGRVCTDDISIAGSAKHQGQTIGYVNEWSQTLSLADGLIGLGFPEQSVMNASALPFNLYSDGSIPAGVLSFDLATTAPSILVGGIDSSKYTGDVTYLDVAGDGRWNVTMKGASIAGKAVEELSNVPVIMDTGTSLIGVPLATAGKMYTSVPGVVPASAISNGHYGTGYWALPCDSNATVAFAFGDATFDVPFVLKGAPSTDVNGTKFCLGSVAGVETSSSAHILGIPFLRTVYSIFDFAGKRVGLAKPAN